MVVDVFELDEVVVSEGVEDGVCFRGGRRRGFYRERERGRGEQRERGRGRSVERESRKRERES